MVTASPSSVGTWGVKQRTVLPARGVPTVRGTDGPLFNTQCVVYVYVGPWGQVAPRLGYVPPAGGRHA